VRPTDALFITDIADRGVAPEPEPDPDPESETFTGDGFYGVDDHCPDQQPVPPEVSTTVLLLL